MQRDAGAGYAMFELLAVLAVTAVGLAVSLPSMDSYIASQRLNNSISLLSTYIQSAKRMSVSTGCGASLSVNGAGSGVNLTFRLLQTDDSSGCRHWFESNNVAGSTGVLIRAGRISNLSIDRNLDIRFRGISGGLDHNTPPAATLSWRDQSMRITVQMLGNLTYRHAS